MVLGGTSLGEISLRETSLAGRSPGGCLFGRRLFGGYLFGRRRRLDFLKFGEIGKRTKTEEFKKGFGGSVDDGASGQILSAHHLDQSPFHEV